MADTFTCTCCGKTYHKLWTDDDALKEYNALTDQNLTLEEAEKDSDIVCEDCYNMLSLLHEMNDK